MLNRVSQLICDSVDALSSLFPLFVSLRLSPLPTVPSTRFYISLGSSPSETALLGTTLRLFSSPRYALPGRENFSLAVAAGKLGSHQRKPSRVDEIEWPRLAVKFRFVDLISPPSGRVTLAGNSISASASPSGGILLPGFFPWRACYCYRCENRKFLVQSDVENSVEGVENTVLCKGYLLSAKMFAAIVFHFKLHYITYSLRLYYLSI